MKVTTKTLAVNCRYDLSIEELVKANRFRGYVNPDVSDDHFWSNKSAAAKKKAVLLCLHSTANDDEVSEAMERLKLRDGLPKELLSLGLDHPDLQKKFTIVARGSAWLDRDGLRYVPSLSMWDGDRGLHLLWRESDWYNHDRFLAFRES